MTTETPFNPENHGFILLENYEAWPHSGPVAYEYKNHPIVNGKYDLKRANYYMLHDGDYYTIWTGTLDPLAVSGWLAEYFNKDVWLDERDDFFRGYIKTDAQGREILKGLRMGGRPSVIMIDDAGEYGWHCYAEDETPPAEDRNWSHIARYNGLFSKNAGPGDLETILNQERMIAMDRSINSIDRLNMRLIEWERKLSALEKHQRKK